MIDLEQEFQQLMRTVLKQIEDKVQSGELTRTEANHLITMVNVRMHPPTDDDRDDLEEGWSESTRACMDAYDRERDDYDRGWSRSSWCGDNG